MGTVHDEILAEAPENKGSIMHFDNVLQQIPEWAVGLPISAKGFVTKRYRKD